MDINCHWLWKCHICIDSQFEIGQAGEASRITARPAPMISRHSIHQLWLAFAFGTVVLAFLFGREHGGTPRRPVFDSRRGQFKDTDAPSADSAYAFCLRGADATSQGRMEDALAAFDKAILLSPDYTDAYSRRAYVWHVRGNLDKAIEDYNEAIRLDPTVAHVYLNRGIVWQTRQDRDMALADHTRRLRDDGHVFAICCWSSPRRRSGP